MDTGALSGATHGDPGWFTKGMTAAVNKREAEATGAPSGATHGDPSWLDAAMTAGATDFKMPEGLRPEQLELIN